MRYADCPAREVNVPDCVTPLLLHQALTSAQRPYAAEFDVPLGIQCYRYSAYLRHRDRARRFLEDPALKVIFVFSEWARRSFAMHYGEQTAAKCRVSYPLASDYSDASCKDRPDFAFISTHFRVKAALNCCMLSNPSGI